MDIYLVRHGQTDGNLASRHQHPDTPLNEVGILQAQEVAAKLLKYNPTHLISSKQKRAVQTAQIISKQIGLVAEVSDDLIEILRPDYLVGERRYGLKMVVYMFLWYLDYRPASYHDGETYADFRSRLRRVEDYFSKLPKGSRAVVVSHAGFIAFFLAHLNYSKKVGPFGALRVFIRMFLMRNTQIIHLTYDGKKWRLK